MSKADEFQKKMDAKYAADKFQSDLDAKYGGDDKSMMQQIAGSGVAKFAAPMIGAAVGGIGGTAAGAPAGPLGSVGLGMAGAAAGAAGGETLRAKLAGEELDYEAINNEAMISGLTEPVGMLLGPGIKASRGLRGAKGFGARGKQFMAGLTEDMLEGMEKQFPGSVAKISQVGVGPKGAQMLEKQIKNTNAIHESLVGASGNPTARALDITRHVDALIAKLDDVASPMARQVENIKEYFLKRHVQPGAKHKVATGIIGPLGQPVFKTVQGPSTPKPIDAKTVLEMKRFAQDQLEGLFKANPKRVGQGGISKRMGAKSAEENFYTEIERGAREWLEGNVAGSAELNLEMRGLIGARRALKSTASKSARNRVARIVSAGALGAGAAVTAPGGYRALPMGGASVLGYTFGHMAEPAITPLVGAGLNAAQNPLVQQLLLRQLPKTVGLGAHQLMGESE